jgi:hypothetical protein
MRPFRFHLFLAVLFVPAAPALAVPPPPPPIGNLGGGVPLCQPAFAIMLAEEESATSMA